MLLKRKTFVLTLVFILLVNCFAAGMAFAANTPSIDLDSGEIGVGEASSDDLENNLIKLWNWFMVIVGFIVAYNIVINAIGLGSKDSRKRTESMEGLGKALVGAVIAFGVWKIIGFAMGLLG